MAEDKPKRKLPRRRKTPVTVREQAEKQARKRTTKKSKIGTKIGRPFKFAGRLGKKEYNPIKMPDNKTGKVLNKRVPLIPKFLRNSWAELKLVTWPSRKDAARLTGAVIVFAVIFAVFIQILDLLFNRLFKIIFIK